LIALYNHCKAFHALPEPGGVMEQDPEILAAFAIIGDEIAAWREREAKKASRRNG